MRLEEKVLYTIYRGEDCSPVKVFKERKWTFENRVTLHATIIGKSHRIFFHANGDCFTEYIAYPIKDMTPSHMDHFPLEVGKSYCRKYRDGGLACQVNIHVSPMVFEDMDDFLDSMGESPNFEVLKYRFKTGYSKLDKAFTGIALSFTESRFYTVHTYPEKGLSIHSKSEIYFSVPTAVI